MIEIYQNEEHKRRVIERGDGYEYIGSYYRNEETIDGKNKNKNKMKRGNVYIRVKCPYCGEEYDIMFGNFNRGSKCLNCCNYYEDSFAYYIQQELKEPLNKYWDWEKNNKLGINPYHIKPQSNKKVWIKCDKVDYHKSYQTITKHFYNGSRCPYCCTRSNKVRPKDSFGALYPEKAKYWDYEKNKKSPYEVRPKSCKGKYWFKCKVCEKSFKVSLDNLNTYERDVICNNCKVSKGENKIINFLNENNINYIHDERYFKDLIGTGNGLLRPDFILPDYKIWIEYDGEQHYEWQEGWQTKENFERLQKHDKLKDKYAKEHNWKLIRIPYWEFDNIEEILEKELNKNN